MEVEVISNRQAGEVFQDSRGLVYTVPIAEPELILRFDGQRTIQLGAAQNGGEGLDLPPDFEHNRVLRIAGDGLLSVSNPTRQVAIIDLTSLDVTFLSFEELGLQGNIMSLQPATIAEEYISAGQQGDTVVIYRWGLDGLRHRFPVPAPRPLSDLRHVTFGDTLMISIASASTYLYRLDGTLIKSFAEEDFSGARNRRPGVFRYNFSDLRFLPDGHLYATSYYHRPALLRYDRATARFSAVPTPFGTDPDYPMVSVPVADSLGNLLYAGGPRYGQRTFRMVTAAGDTLFLGQSLEDAIVSNRHQEYLTTFFTNDLSQTLWAASEEQGWLKISFPRKRVKNDWKNFSFHRPITHQGGSSVMIASEPSALWRLGPTDGYDDPYLTTTWYHQRKPGVIRNIKRLLHGPNGTIWGSDTDGLFRIDTASMDGSEVPVPGRIDPTWAIFSDGRVLCPVEDGRVFTAVPPYDTFLTVSPERLPANGRIQLIQEGTDGNYWLCTDQGVFYGSIAQNAVWRRVLRPLGDDLLVHHWYPAAGDQQWWLSTNRGWLLYDAPRDKIIRHYTTRDGLANDDVRATIFVSGYFWIATRGGLSRFDPGTGVFRTLSVDEGFTSPKFNAGAAYAPGIDLLAFGTELGLNYFHPEDLIDESVAVIGISSLAYYDGKKDQQVKLVGLNYEENQLYLPANNRSLQVEMFLDDLTDVAGHVFAYRLHSREEWKEIGHRAELLFPTLPAGTNRVEIAGRTRFGNWSDPVVVKVRVAAFFYRTWWFQFLMILLVGGTVAAWVYRLRRERSNLHQRVEERTATIRQDKEVIEQQAAELLELDAAKTRFFANFSHELRTPLTVIKGFAAESFQRRSSMTADEWGNNMAMIDANSDRLLLMINQLLDLGKLEAGRLKPRYQRLDVRPELDLIVASFEILAKNKEVHLRHNIAFDRLMADLDADKFLKVVYNLLSNAIKFTPAGGEIFVDAKCSATDTLIVRVQDTGIGIAAEDLETVFERFSQLDDGLNRRAEGSGIGLNFSRDLTTLMGGSLTVKSQPGQGSTFSLLLPRWQADGVASRGAEQRTAPTISVPTPNNSPVYEKDESTAGDGVPLVLLVEDNPDIIAYLRICLNGRYQIIAAANGKAGVELALERIPDLIISDVMMPVMDGLELCRILKNDRRTSHVPIILLTALSSVTNRVAGLREGADDYLSKPFAREELLTRIENLLRNRALLQRYFTAKKARNLPELVSEVDIDYHQVESDFLHQLTAYIESRIDDPTLRTEDLAEVAQISQVQLWRKMKSVTGLSSNDFLRHYRLRRAAELLRQQQLSVSEVAYRVGFSDPSYFSKRFSREFGVAPSVYAKSS